MRKHFTGLAEFCNYMDTSNTGESSPKHTHHLNIKLFSVFTKILVKLNVKRNQTKKRNIVC